MMWFCVSCRCHTVYVIRICFFKQKTAYEMRISDWGSDVCSSDLGSAALRVREAARRLFDRLVDHAAKAQPRCGRAGARPCRADHWLHDVTDGDDEGPAARLFQGHAGRQAAGIRSL